MPFSTPTETSAAQYNIWLQHPGSGEWSGFVLFHETSNQSEDLVLEQKFEELRDLLAASESGWRLSVEKLGPTMRSALNPEPEPPADEEPEPSE